MIFDMEAFHWVGFPSIDDLNDPSRNTMQVDWVRSYRAVPLLEGDYKGDGFVSQEDLDLVLLNWGRDVSSTGVPDGWVNQRPDASIAQAHLDGVLLNWGGGTPPSAGALPEPTTLALLGVGSLALRRRSGSAVARPCRPGTCGFVWSAA